MSLKMSDVTLYVTCRQDIEAPAHYICLMRSPDQLLHPTPAGLYCPVGDFYIDPVRAVDRAVITHGHAAVSYTHLTLPTMRTV